jgi:hypothetical protein
MLDLFKAVPISELRKSPNVLYVRAIYSLVVLMKAEYAVGTDEEMSELLESQSLKVEYYLDTVLRITSEAMGAQKCRNPSHWNFLINAKLKSWWDEYEDWRKEGRHLKRRKTNAYEEGETATGDVNQTPAFADPKPNPHPHGLPGVFPSQTTSQQPQAHFSMGSAYGTPAPWNTNDLRLDTSAPTQSIGGEQTGFTPDMGDFSTAFQNGDLYLWNDMTLDNFGGPYSGMGFGGMNSQGF